MSVKYWAENTGFAFHPQTVLLFTVTDFPLLGKMLLRQKFLRAFKYSLPSITGKGAVHIVNQLSRIALLKQWPAIYQLMCTHEESCHLCSIWHFNLSEELLLSPAGKQWTSTQHSDSLNKGSPGRILSQPIVTGKCPSSPPNHEHFPNSSLPLYATYGQTFSHPPSHLLQFFCCLEVGPGIFKVWNKCVEKEKLLIKLLSMRLSLIHIKVDKQAGYY